MLHIHAWQLLVIKIVKHVEDIDSQNVRYVLKELIFNLQIAQLKFQPHVNPIVQLEL
jgi:hypothetical protein